MTDARMPERYLMDRRLHRLSSEDFRAFVYALMWSVANRTDGVIAMDDVGLIPHFPSDGLCSTRLVAAGVWDLHPDGYYIVDFEATQTSSSELEVLENARRRDREKKRRQRAAKAAAPELSPVTSPGTFEETAQDRQGLGKDRPGQAGQDLPSNHLPNGAEPLNDLQKRALNSWGQTA